VFRPTKKSLVIGGATLAIVGGGGAAFAAAGDGLFGSNDRQAFLNDAAGQLNVKPADLEKALLQAYDDRIDAAVKAGKLTQAQGDELKARATTNGGLALPFLGAPGGHRPGFGGFGMLGPGGSTNAAAATYLGLTQDQLESQLDSGKSLAQIAQAQNKSVAGLKQAMLDATKKDLDAAVKAGKLTQSQADSMLSDFSTRLDDVIQRPGGGPHFGRSGFHGPGAVVHGSTLTAAATYLGLTPAQLDAQLDSGKTLAQVAQAQNKSVAGLKQAMLDAAKKDLDAAVKAGKLTQGQESSILSELPARLDDQIRNGGPRFQFRGPGPNGPRGFGFGGRPGGSYAPPSSLPPAA
jgi:hypothetical protein